MHRCTDWVIIYESIAAVQIDCGLFCDVEINVVNNNFVNLSLVYQRSKVLRLALLCYAMLNLNSPKDFQPMEHYWFR